MTPRFYSAYGFGIRFLCDQQTFEQTCRSSILPNWKLVESDERADLTFRIEKVSSRFNVFVNEKLRARQITCDGVRELIERDCHLELATHCPAHVFVHAAAAFTGCGIILFPGASFSGKSTLVKALCERGCKLYSDEFAVLDGSGAVHSFPHHVKRRIPFEGVRRIDPVDLGWAQDFEPVKVSHVLFLEYRKGHELRVESISRGRGLALLVQNSVSATVYPERVLPVLKKVAEEALFFQGTRGEVDDAADKILALIEPRLRLK